VRLHIFGALILAAALPYSAYSQQQEAASTAGTEGSTEQAAGPQHVVTPPKVTCKGNTVSISANYSTLGAILNEIQRCTGVQFDAPEMAKSSLVFDEIGPGPSNDVLAALLTASGFDYVIGASAADPEKIERIVLLSRSNEKDAGSSELKGTSSARRAFSQMREAARPHPPDEQLAATAEVERSDADASEAAPPAAARGAEPEAPVAKVDSSSAKPGDSPKADGQAPPPSSSGDPATQGKANADAAAATNADAQASPPAPDTASQGKPTSPTDDRIANMQLLFEQRKQMMQQQQQQSQHPAPQ
jgi:hypothetical protein